MDAPHLSIVIPAYDELPSFERGALDEVAEWMDRVSYEVEVLVVDDGSTDGTAHRVEAWSAERPGWRVLRRPHAGKPAAVHAGVMAARGAWVLFTDFDQSTPIAEVERFLAATAEGARLVIGSRELEGARRVDEPLYRHLMGRGFNYVVQGVALPGIRDSQCGFKLFEAELARQLFSALVVYADRVDPRPFTGAFDVELLFLARSWGIRVVEIPIYWRFEPSSRVAPLRDSAKMLRDVLAIRLSALRGRYPSAPAPPSASSTSENVQ